MRVAALALVAALLLAGGAAVRAQEEVEVRTWWPEHPDNSFFAGKLAGVVMGVRNIGSAPLNVSYAVANLASPYNATMNLYNFTAQYLGDVALGQGDETSAEYKIFLPAALPPREFMLQMSVVYQVGGAFKTKQFVNATIQVIEEPRFIDTQLLGLYAILAAALAGIFYSGTEFAKGKGWIKKTKPAPRPAAASTNKEEWLRGTAADPKLRKRT